MDVVNPDQAELAEKAGAVAVMALERVPADIRKAGGVARMADPEIILAIMDTVSIPVMAKVRIGHQVEAQIIESLGVDMIDESEVLTPADEQFHIDKKQFSVPFVCGARDLGEALRRIHEGAAMIRTKGEAGTGNVVEAVRHMHNIMGEIRSLQGKTAHEIVDRARALEAPAEPARGDCPDGKTSGRELLCRGYRNPGGCGTHDADGGGRRLCRLGDLPFVKPCPDGRGDCGGGAPLYRTCGYRPGQQGARGSHEGPRHSRTPRG